MIYSLLDDFLENNKNITKGTIIEKCKTIGQLLDELRFFERSGTAKTRFYDITRSEIDSWVYRTNFITVLAVTNL